MQLLLIILWLRLCCFAVDVEENRDITVLQLTDPQIQDATQVRDGEELRTDQINYWQPENMDENCFDIIRQTIEKTNLDLILITGDLVRRMLYIQKIY